MHSNDLIKAIKDAQAVIDHAIPLPPSAINPHSLDRINLRGLAFREVLRDLMYEVDTDNSGSGGQ